MLEFFRDVWVHRTMSGWNSHFAYEIDSGPDIKQRLPRVSKLKSSNGSEIKSTLAQIPGQSHTNSHHASQRTRQPLLKRYHTPNQNQNSRFPGIKYRDTVSSRAKKTIPLKFFSHGTCSRGPTRTGSGEKEIEKENLHESKQVEVDMPALFVDVSTDSIRHLQQGDGGDIAEEALGILHNMKGPIVDSPFIRASLDRSQAQQLHNNDHAIVSTTIATSTPGPASILDGVFGPSHVRNQENPASLTRLERLGYGASSTVYKSFYTKELKLVAEKVIVVSDSRKFSQLVSELTTLRKMLAGVTRSKYIVNLIDVFSSPMDSTVSVCLEYMHASLQDVVVCGGCQEESVLASISSQILKGIVLYCIVLCGVVWCGVV